VDALIPRPYQVEAEGAIWQYFQAKTGNPLIALPTGTGKSLVIGWFIQHVMERYPSSRILALTHVKELIKQNSSKLEQIWPSAPFGIYSAGLRKKEHQWPIIFGGIGTVANSIEVLGSFDLMLVDEAHLMSGKDDSMYGAVVTALKNRNPCLKVIGFTATPYRTGQGLLTESGLFTDICYDCTTMRSFNRLIDDGYMCMLIPKRTNLTFDLSKVPIRNGDYATGELEERVDHHDVTYTACKEALNIASNRNCWLTFAAGIKHAEHIAEMLNNFGIPSKAIHSKIPESDRDQYISDFRTGKLRCAVTNNILTTGFDHPPIDLILMMRPTLSTGLWVQMLGRGTRPSPETQKEDCLCIAKGQRVLTDSGLVPIEQVTIQHKVWDGTAFVDHDGVVYKGEKNVISYAGLTATPDHNVWTKQGWSPFGFCRQEQIGISITGFDKTAVSTFEGYFTNNHSQGQTESCLCSYTMHRLFAYLRNGVHKFNYWKSKLPSLWQPASMSKMVRKALQRCKTTLSESIEQTLLRLWWKRNTIQLLQSYSNGCVDSNQFRFIQTSSARSNQQRWTLRSWKYSLDNTSAKHAQCATKTSKVYDIVNAGPFNRFTVEGLLVHNCLDFAGNTPRLGPINDPVLPRKKGQGQPGVAPIRICDQCGTYNHASATVCYVCGYVFPHQVKISATAGTDELIRTDVPMVHQFRVDRVLYNGFQSNGFNILRVNYICGLRDFSEIVCLEHPGKAGGMAVQWWKQRMGSEKAPPTVNEALNWCRELTVPKQVWVDVNRKYPKIIKAEF
jgi:superfamily II DNA or RNA helicase